MKKVAIILPAYNAEKTIGKAIESILNQDYNDYELIIVNDHSNDKTEKVCLMYQDKKPDKIKFYNNLKESKGVSSARNLAILKSNSEYLMFIDSDDSYEKDMISNMVEKIENTDMIICGFKKVIKDSKEEVKKTTDEIVAKNTKEIKKLIEVLQRKELFNQLWNKMFKSKIIREHDIRFSEKISLGEDYRFILEYIENIKKIKVINKVLYTYYSDKSGLALKYHEDNLKTKLDNIIHHREFYIRKNLDTYYTDKLYILTIMSGFASIISNNKMKDARKLIKQYIYDKEMKKNSCNIGKKSNSIKIKMILKILQIKNVTFLYCIGCICNIGKKILK